MKDGTRSFYESTVRHAVERVVHSLDEALDLADLARTASLSPLHFHRVFRGMVGETPIELHRRLRLERAAWRLANADTKIGSIAFEAGYETHESFTRSFREAYWRSPSEFRSLCQSEDAESRPPVELGSRSGLHFSDALKPELSVTFEQGDAAMQVTIEEFPERRVAALAHVGPYKLIIETFRRLMAMEGVHELAHHPGSAMVTIYHDDPDSTPKAELRSEAGVLVPSHVAIPAPLTELRIPAGRYARTTHLGPYTHLPDTWWRFMGRWLPHSGQRASDGAMYDVYHTRRINPPNGEFRTDLYLAIE